MPIITPVIGDMAITAGICLGPSRGARRRPNGKTARPKTSRLQLAIRPVTSSATSTAASTMRYTMNTNIVLRRNRYDGHQENQY